MTSATSFIPCVYRSIRIKSVSKSKKNKHSKHKLINEKQRYFVSFSDSILMYNKYVLDNWTSYMLKIDEFELCNLRNKISYHIKNAEDLVFLTATIDASPKFDEGFFCQYVEVEFFKFYFRGKLIYDGSQIKKRTDTGRIALLEKIEPKEKMLLAV